MVQIGGKPSCSIYVSWLLISLSIAIWLWILDTFSKSGNKLTMLKSSLAPWYDFKNCPPPTTIRIIKTRGRIPTSVFKFMDTRGDYFQWYGESSSVETIYPYLATRSCKCRFKWLCSFFFKKEIEPNQCSSSIEPIT